MPIYAYKCASCGHAQDVLQKLSEAPLTVCPACGQSTFGKQVTAAGFQLKGSGWYVTDFRDKPAAGKGEAKPSEATKPGGDGAARDGTKAADASAPATPAPAAAAPSPAAASPAPAAAKPQPST